MNASMIRKICLLGSVLSSAAMAFFTIIFNVGAASINLITLISENNSLSIFAVVLLFLVVLFRGACFFVTAVTYFLEFRNTGDIIDILTAICIVVFSGSYTMGIITILFIIRARRVNSGLTLMGIAAFLGYLIQLVLAILGIVFNFDFDSAFISTVLSLIVGAITTGTYLFWFLESVAEDR